MVVKLKKDIRIDRLATDRRAGVNPPLHFRTGVSLGLGSKAIPRGVTEIPDGCFVGISRPHQTIQEARRGALGSATSQILQAMVLIVAF